MVRAVEMYRHALKNKEKIFAVAPMMDWTDRHCRVFHRQLTREALLYTEMVTTGAIIHGDRERLLGFSDVEHPVACQLGGSDPRDVAEAARIIEGYGYDEVNINVGCPSDRVQSGSFGACLMAEPELVGECVAAMKDAVSIPVTVKCRIGIDEQDTEEALDNLADSVVAAGTDALWVHARKAWLKGLSPKENRDVPPLDYDRVYRLKERLPDVWVGINGGINTLYESEQHLKRVDGVMLGRAAYQQPALLAGVDKRIYGAEAVNIRIEEAVEALFPYVSAQLAQGVRLSRITRHILGLFQGTPGARAWRRTLSTDAVKEGAGLEVIDAALREITGGGLDKRERTRDRQGAAVA
jgi:tRNA-dihydrouridine synthase A